MSMGKRWMETDSILVDLKSTWADQFNQKFNEENPKSNKKRWVYG